jgi:2-hydroxychromene-2-carboxylate isomerase
MADIEYFYAAHSAFAYIGSARLSEIAAAAGSRIIHKPMDLRRVIAAASPNDRTEARKAYFFGREIERWAEARSAAIIAGRPTHHDNDIALPNGVLIAALQAGHNIDALAHALLQAHWRDDADLANEETLASLAEQTGFDPAPLLGAALSQNIQAIYEANTAEAIERSVFGSPTYFVAGDMFYGQDHLELVERALKQPFAGAWPRD